MILRIDALDKEANARERWNAVASVGGRRAVGALAACAASAGLLAAVPAPPGIGQPQPPTSPGTLLPPIVFVSRAIPQRGTVYWDAPRGMPGVMAYSRFQVSSPGRLLLRDASGAVRMLIDGAAPTTASLNLVDVNAPDVSYDGSTIVFAGLEQGPHDRGPVHDPGAWRLYAIGVDGQGLRRVTRSDRDDLDLSQFGGLANEFRRYDDTDPVWLPDGRIVFSSTRWPAFGQYGAVRATNLFVVDADGANLHRITAERNGADRPLVDPLTGRVVYARWWRNFRLASNDMSSDPFDGGYFFGYRRHLGLVSAADADTLGGVPGGGNNLTRNAWHLATVNPDGTDLRQFAGQSTLFFTAEDENHAYGGSFGADGSIYTNFFPMKNGTEAAGFGGIRRFERGPSIAQPLVGVTTNVDRTLASERPPSYGVYTGAYASEPEVLPDGRLLVSWAPDVYQDYGLYTINYDGSGLSPVLDFRGMTELRARAALPRRRPPVIADTVTRAARPLPPREAAPYDLDGTFVFDALNVYFNAPVDTPIVSAAGVGTAGTIRFYLDHQRLQPGSLERADWPILLGEARVNADGSIPPTVSPANLPLFEQLRSAQPAYEVPLTGRGRQQGGAAHVAGMNFGRPGETVRCVGCHAGHSMIPVPSRADAAWTNLAPGATLHVSSIEPTIGGAEGLVDRRVHTGPIVAYWRSDPAQPADGQWVELQFPGAIRIRTVRLYNPRHETNVDTIVERVAVALFTDGDQPVARASVGTLSPQGTDVPFPDVRASRVRVTFESVSGTFLGRLHAALAEIEVIANADGRAAAR